MSKPVSYTKGPIGAVKFVDDFLSSPRELAQELECRLADHEANPGDAVPWYEVKAAISKLLGK